VSWKLNSEAVQSVWFEVSKFYDRVGVHLANADDRMVGLR